MSLRLKEAKQHLEQLVAILQDSRPTWASARTPLMTECSLSVPPRDAGALAVVLGNLGVVCHEQGDADQAVDAFEVSLQIASSIVSTKRERYKR